jgi:hypothetical protein
MGGAVLMFIHSFGHLPAMLHSDRIQRLPILRLSTLSASILASLLGLTLPASAEQISWSPGPPPFSQSEPAKPGAASPQLTKPDPRANNLPPGERAKDGDQPLPEVSGKNASTKRESGNQEVKITGSKTDVYGGSGKGKPTGSAIDEKAKEFSRYNLQTAQKEVLASLVQGRWIAYLIAVLIFLLLIWLSILSWLVYQGLATANSKSSKLNKQSLEMKFELENLARSLDTQKTAQLQLQQLVNETIGRLERHGNTLSNLQADLTVQERRLFDIQSGQHAGTNLDGGIALFKEPELDRTTLISEPQSIHDPETSLTDEYQEAFFRGDRSALRRMMPDELNITQHSEDALMKTASIPTQLEIVKTGGSYLLIHREGKHLLVPEFQILTSFTTNQLAKGIFSYQRENISIAELRRPAEVREVGGLWEVVTMGVIAVPT